eukprot:TRINITY_DN6243_c0_g3_i1.p1 TRINITY_DN6243_c0_g3~~TRINITY_DN6243_c0_g3_i1.p1  ORF type:complete len:1109 (+),score=384.57 TRINITY_DN6243_c0_g3_i1:97-3423(+)
MIEEGALVFFEHPEQSWILGHVSKWDGKKGACKGSEGDFKADGLDSEQITIARDDTINEDKDDLMSLTILHDATILRCLKIRYMRDVIYTNIGPIVVALNPFNFKIPWYTDDNMPKYLAEGDRIEVNLPHSWAVAHNTYHELINDQQDQCILVSGESGAGKTEASKIVMKYLANVSTKMGTEEQKVAGLAVGGKINMTGPPLETWGNAKTVRNNNSSRFGKFMKVRFNSDGLLVGAFVIKYLLEKSRIVSAGPNERVYHSFYLAYRGKDQAALLLNAGPAESYSNLNSGKCLTNPEFDSAEEYQEVCDALVGIGVPDAEVLSMWKVVAGVMHSQNVEFDADGEGSQVKGQTMPHLERAGQVWGVQDLAALKKELCVTTLVIQGKPVEKLLNPAKAADCRDSLSKHLYDNEFSDLIEICNRLLDKSDGSGNWIGLLDIFGFEDFEVNSFEQVCINLANESLQGHYNTYIFARDMDECRAEGIDVTSVVFPDNSPCLQMVSGKGGLMALLDEECALGKGSDDGFLSKIVDKFGGGKNPFFGMKKLSKTSFIIHHYAKSVEYTIDGFLEKNRDTLKDAFKLMMRESADSYIAKLLPQPDPDAKKLTVGGFYKTQLRDLMDLINSTNPHWIRCVKPHPAKKPLHFHGLSTFAQLSSAGVLGTVKIRKAGFPIRIPFGEFYMKYRVLGDGQLDPANAQASSKAILGKADLDAKLAQMGKTRVFMKTEAYIALETLKKQKLTQSAVVVQAWCLGYCSLQGVRKKVFANNQDTIEKLRGEVVAKLAEKRAREAEERRRREEEEAKRLAEEAEARRRWEEENAEQVRREEEERRQKELAERMANASQALVADDGAARGIIAAEEDRLWRELLQTELEVRMAALFRSQRADVERAETLARGGVSAEEVEAFARFLDIWDDLSSRGRMESARVEAEQMLSARRAERLEKEAARKELVKAKQRTVVERLVLPKRPEVNEGARRELDAQEQQRLESLRARTAAASPPPPDPAAELVATARAASPPPATAPVGVGDRIWLLSRMEHGVVDHVAPGGAGQLRVALPTGHAEWFDREDVSMSDPAHSRPAPAGSVSPPPGPQRGSPPRPASAGSPSPPRWGAR